MNRIYLSKLGYKRVFILKLLFTILGFFLLSANIVLAQSVTITSDAVANTIELGASATFTATPSGTSFTKYQWIKNGIAIVGATNSTYTTSSLVNGDIISVKLSANTGEIVSSNLVSYLDAGNPSSYTGAGTSWNDISGNNNNVTIPSALASSYSTSTGDGSLNFQGNSSTTIQSNAMNNWNLNTTNALSVETWIKRTNYSNYHFWFSTPDLYYRLGVNQNGYLFWDMAHYVDRSPGILVSEGVWHHIVYTAGIESGNITTRVYVDGALVSFLNEGITSLSSFTNYLIGDGQDPGHHPLKGNMGLMRIYNKALSASEVSQNYNAETNRFSSTVLLSNQVTMTVNVPTISVSSTTNNFGYTSPNSTSSEFSYTLSAIYLLPTSGDVTITPPSGFEISLTSGSNFTASPLTVSYTSRTISSQTIYVRFKPTQDIEYSGNITHSGGTATTKNIAVTGSGAKIYCTASTSSLNVMGIKSVKFNTINNQTSDINNGYNNYYSSNSTTVAKGQSYTLTVAGGNTYQQYFKAWFDWNDDGDFDDAGESFRLGSPNASFYNSLYITIPETAVTGNIRMRIRSGYSAYSEPTACGSINYGECEDYSITIAELPAIIVSSPTLDFGYNAPGNTSVEKSFALSAIRLSPESGDLTITPPSNFEISLTSGSGFTTSPLIVPFASNSLASTTIYVRFKPTEENNYQDTIVITGGSATTQHVIISATSIKEYCSATVTYPNNYGISRVEFNTIDNETDYSGYNNYFETNSTTVTKGQSYTLTVTGGIIIQYFKAWFDWNNDGDFDDSGETYSLGVPNFSFVNSRNIVIPINAVTGIIRMRIRSDYYYYSEPTSCGTTIYGDCEDYAIEIIESPSILTSTQKLDFGYNASGTTSDEMSFNVSAILLPTATGNITITPPSNFEISLTSGSGFTASPITIPYTSNTLASKRIYVRFKPTEEIGYQDTIIITGGSVSAAKIEVTGVTSRDYCAANSNNDYMGIYRVAFNTIDNNTDLYSGYKDYTATSTTVVKGQTYSLTAAAWSWGEDQIIYAWFDWNNDGIFDDNTEMFFVGFIGMFGENSINITIPETAASKNIRMRIRSEESGYIFVSSCGQSDYGECHDYTINIIDAPNVTSQSASSITTTSAIGNGTITKLGYPLPTAYGFCWNTTGNPTISDNTVDNGATTSSGEFTASISGLTSSTTYFVRAYVTNIDGTSYGDEKSFTTKEAGTYYMAKSAGNWSSTSVWSTNTTGETDPATYSIDATETPDNANSVSIIIDADVSVDADVSIDQTIINSGKTIIVNKENILTIADGTDNDLIIDGSIVATGKITINGNILNNGTLTLKSDATGTATLLDNGTISGSGTFNVEQYLTGSGATTPNGRFWYISSPVASATSTIVDAASANVLKSYDETKHSWVEVLDNTTTLPVGTGYFARLGVTSTSTFTGTLNNGDITLYPSRSGTSDEKRGFNLVGNPYPSYLNWDDVEKINIQTTMWYRAYNGLSMVFDTYNALGEVGTDNNGTEVNKFIPPMQAFWVRVSNDGDIASLTFKNSMRSHQTGNVLKSNTQNDIIRLKVSNGTNSDEAIVVFNTDATNGIDVFDSEKMSNNDASIPELYTVANSQKLVINGLESAVSNPIIPLGFKTAKAGTYTITAKAIEGLNGVPVILEDKLLNKIQDLTQSSSYSFSSDSVDNASRFVLRLKSNSATTESKIEQSTILIYSKSKSVVVSTNETKGNIIISDVLGRIVAIQSIFENQTTIPVSAGFYFVKVTNETKVETIKLYVE